MTHSNHLPDQPAPLEARPSGSLTGKVRVPGDKSVSHRGFHHCELFFDNCRVNKRQVLGEVHHGFDVANTWLGATRLTVAAQCVGRAYRALDMAMGWAATRKQFGQTIGKFQGVITPTTPTGWRTPATCCGTRIRSRATTC